MLSISNIELYAKEFLSNNFDGMALDVPIEVNGRLSRAMGRFIAINRKSHSIELSKNLVQYNDMEVIQDVLKHELIHYALYEMGLPNGDDDKEFINTCNRLGAPLTETFSIKQPVHQYKCSCTVHERRRRIKNFNTSKYKCMGCNEILEYIGFKKV